MEAVEEKDDDGEEVALAMTRPKELAGFPQNALLAAIMLPSFPAILTQNAWLFLGLPVTMLSCYLIVLADSHFFDLVGTCLQLKTARNARHWGCRRYAPR